MSETRRWLWPVIIVVVLVAIFLIAFPPVPTVPTDNVPEEIIADYDLTDGVETTPSPQYTTVSECASLSTSEYLDCHRQIAVANNNPAVCDALPNEEVDWCKARVFAAQTNETACAQLSQNAANQCFHEIARATGRADACSAISVASFRADCLREAAYRAQDTGLCNLIEPVEIKDDCLLRIILDKETVSPSDCQQVVESDSRDDCYYGVALIADDAQICGLISDEYWRSNCQIDVTQGDGGFSQ